MYAVWVLSIVWAIVLVIGIYIRIKIARLKHKLEIITNEEINNGSR